MEYAVETSSLVKRFGSFTAVAGLDLNIKKGEVYGLLGPNGSGKTTTIRMLCNRLKPTSGVAKVLGIAIPDKAISNSIGYMPQETALYSELSVHHNLALYGKIFGMTKEAIAKKEEELLKLVDLKDWRDEPVANLSGGMKHRTSLICTLIHDPKVLFLDEPTVGVDPELRISFWDYFYRLKKKGKTVIITTHYMDEAQRCTMIGMVRSGKLIAEGTPSDIMAQAGTKSLEDAFLSITNKNITKNEDKTGGGK